jgi:hypothetical protein
MDPSSIIKEKKATFVVGGAYSSSPQNATTLRIFNENMQTETINITKTENFARKLSVTFIAEPGLEKYIGIKCKFAGDEKEMSFVEHLLKFGIKVTVSKTINIKKTITEAMDDEDISRALNVILETNENRKKQLGILGLFSPRWQKATWEKCLTNTDWRDKDALYVHKIMSKVAGVGQTRIIVI